MDRVPNQVVRSPVNEKILNVPNDRRCHTGRPAIVGRLPLVFGVSTISRFGNVAGATCVHVGLLQYVKKNMDPGQLESENRPKVPSVDLNQVLGALPSLVHIAGS
jgi:hypothetical protein